jgi:hypothetical protein
MSRTIKVLVALVVIAVLWKVVLSSPSDVEYEYDPIEDAAEQ